MKRILILMHYMELGGAERALLGLLQSLDPARAQVDLFIYDHRGELMPLIPMEKVNLLPPLPAYTMLERPIKELVKKGFWRLALARLWGRRKASKDRCNNVNKLDLAHETFFQGQSTVKVLPKVNPNVEYDVAISFLTPHFIVLDKVNAKVKVGWIHTDYTKVYVNANEELKMWQRLDKIVSISSSVTETFLQVFPTLKEKIVEIENILSPNYIHQRVLSVPSDMSAKNDCVNLLTIGRFSPQKNMENIPAICHRLLQDGLDVVWYIIGYGSPEIENVIKSNIVKEQVEGHVVLLGKRDNPYPYIKASDIYVQPSIYEGKSITVREAQILCKPVLVTNYPTAKSQINDGVDGVIAPLDNDGCAKALGSFIKDSSKRQSIEDYLKKHDYGNVGEIEKVYAL